MADIITVEQMQNASLDTQTLEKFVNGSETQVNNPRLLPNVDIGSIAELRKKVSDKITTDAQATIDAAKAQVDASKAAIDNQLKTIPSGHKGYATLAAAQAAQSSLAANTLVEVTNDTTTANNGVYLWDGTTLTKSNYDAVAAAQTKAADTAKTEIAKSIQSVIVSKNLIDGSKVTTGYLVATNGTLTANSSYKASDYVPVLPNTTYVRNFGGAWAEYDANKQFISYKSNATGDGNQFTTSANAAYVRLSQATAQTEFYMQKGGIVGDTDVYATKNQVVTESIAKQTVIDAIAPNNVLDQSIAVRANQVNFLTRYSPNIFDSYNQTNGKKLKFSTVGSTTYAANVTASNYWTSGLVPVTANQAYKLSFYQQYVIYDANLNVLVNQDSQYLAVKEVVMPSNAAYLQFSNINTDANYAPSKMIVALSANYPSEYVPYSRFVNNSMIVNSTQWLGKSILWMGTSIPNGSGYPEQVGRNLLATVANNTKGGGRVRAFKTDSTWEFQANLQFQFTLKKSEVDARYGSMLGKTVKSGDYLVEDPSGVVLTQAMLDALTASNYEQKLLPFITTTDLFVIDYGINDGVDIATQKSAETLASEGDLYNRSHFAGAVNFIIKQIYDAKKTAGQTNYQIILVSHYTRSKAVNGSDSVNQLVNVQQSVAKYWGLPFINLADNCGVNDLNLTDFASDKLHPAKDGVLSKRISQYISDKLKELHI